MSESAGTPSGAADGGRGLRFQRVFHFGCNPHLRFVVYYRAGRIQELRDRYEAKWMEYERYTHL